MKEGRFPIREDVEDGVSEKDRLDEGEVAVEEKNRVSVAPPVSLEASPATQEGIRSASQNVGSPGIPDAPGHTHLEETKDASTSSQPHAGEISGDDIQTFDIREHVVQSILEGVTQLISFPGTSQYSTGAGSSACGLASLNCAKVLLGKKDSNADPSSFIASLISRETVEEITSICSLWSNELHLEVDEIHRMPYFDLSLTLVSTNFPGVPSVETFRKFLVDELMGMETSAAAIITRPPEILTCVKFTISHHVIFLIFDSHARPSHPRGAGLTFSTSVDDTAAHLAEVLAVDPGLFADEPLQWEAQLLGQFSGHVFVSKMQENATDDLLRTVLKSSLATLESDAQTRHLKSENSRLQADVGRLSGDLSVSRAATRQLESRIISLMAELTRYEEEVLGLTKELTMVRANQQDSTHSTTHSTHTNAQLNGDDIPTQRHPPQNSGSLPPVPEETFEMGPDVPAKTIGKQRESSGGIAGPGNRKRVSFGTPLSKAAPSLQDQSSVSQSELRPFDHSDNQVLHAEPTPLSPEETVNDLEDALRLQREFDEEHKRLKVERQKLTGGWKPPGLTSLLDKFTFKQKASSPQLRQKQKEDTRPRADPPKGADLQSERNGLVTYRRVEQQQEAGSRAGHKKQNSLVVHQRVPMVEQHEKHNRLVIMRHVADPGWRQHGNGHGATEYPPVKLMVDDNVAVSAAPPQGFDRRSQRSAMETVEDEAPRIPPKIKQVEPVVARPSVPSSSLVRLSGPGSSGSHPVSKPRERTKDEVTHPARGMPSLSLVDLAKKQSELSRTLELAGDIEGAIKALSSAVILANTLLDSREFNGDGNKGPLWKAFMDFYETEGKTLKARADYLGTKFRELEKSRSAASNSTALDTDFFLKPVGSFTDRLRALNDPGIDVSPVQERRLSQGVPSPLPPRRLASLLDKRSHQARPKQSTNDQDTHQRAEQQQGARPRTEDREHNVVTRRRVEQLQVEPQTQHATGGSPPFLGHSDYHTAPIPPPADFVDDMEYARQQQKEFDEEDIRLRAERQRLANGQILPASVSLFDKFPLKERTPQGLNEQQARHRAQQQREAEPQTEGREHNGLASSLRVASQSHEHDGTAADYHSLVERIGGSLMNQRRKREPERHDVGNAADQQLKLDTQRRDQEHPIQQQRAFNEEDKFLKHQLHHLVNSTPPAFDCNICLDTHAMDYVVSVDACEHQFCRECMKNHITSRLTERRFPILCPVCATGKGRKPGVITHLLAQDVGISESEDIVWHELEVSGFSLTIICRGCQRGVSVDREDYDEADLITCPLPNCNSTWCKHCQQISSIDSKHSCDGTLEFQDLVEREGLKKCPGCKVPIQKTEGCYHMACKAPGCNTHFCYRCGVFIVRSVVPDEIDVAVQRHYEGCGDIFDVPD